MPRQYSPGDRVTDKEEVFFGTVKSVHPDNPDLYLVDWDDLGEPGSTSVDHVDTLRPSDN